MGDAFGVHRMDKTEIIDMASDFGEERRDVTTALPVLRKIPHRLHNPLRRGRLVAGVRDLARVEKVNHLPVSIKKERLVVERIDMAGTTLHKHKNDAFGPGRQRRKAGLKRIVDRTIRECGKCKAAEPAGSRLKELTA